MSDWRAVARTGTVFVGREGPVFGGNMLELNLTDLDFGDGSVPEIPEETLKLIRGDSLL